MNGKAITAMEFSQAAKFLLISTDVKKKLIYRAVDFNDLFSN